MVTQSLAEITVLAQKAGVPRHAFLDFMNQSVMGSTFSRYKTPAFVNLDFKVTFTPQAPAQGPGPRPRRGAALRRADAARLDHARQLQQLIGRGMDEEDFAKLIVLQAQASGLELNPENVQVGTGSASEMGI